MPEDLSSSFSFSCGQNRLDQQTDDVGLVELNAVVSRPVGVTFPTDLVGSGGGSRPNPTRPLIALLSIGLRFGAHFYLLSYSYGKISISILSGVKIFSFSMS